MFLRMLPLSLGLIIASGVYLGSPLALAQSSYQILAQKLLDNKDISGAIAVYSQAIRNTPDQPQAYIYRGQLLQSQGEIILALADFTRAIALAPKTSGYYLYRANAYRLMGRNLEARQDLAEAFILAPNDLKNYAARGLFHLRIGKYQQAISDFDLCLQKYQSAELLILRAEAYQALGKPEHAQRDRILAAALQKAQHRL